MLSQHILVGKVETELYPESRAIRDKCHELFNKQFNPGCGPLGMRGTNELDFTIQHLRSAANLLEMIAKEQGISVAGSELSNVKGGPKT